MAAGFRSFFVPILKKYFLIGHERFLTVHFQFMPFFCPLEGV
jgi:hypothetical protein